MIGLGSASQFSRGAEALAQEWRMAARGTIPGVGMIHKFGFAEGVAAAAGECTLWDGVAFGIFQRTQSVTAAIDSISSDNATDTAEIRVVGVNASFEEIIQTVALNGQTRVALATPLLDVYRAQRHANTVGNVWIYENTTLSSGRPTDNTKVRAIVQPDYGKTEMLVYTVPCDRDAYLFRWNSEMVSRVGASAVVHLEFTNGARTTEEIGTVSDASSRPAEYPLPLYIPPCTRIEVTVQTTSSTPISVAGQFDLLLIKRPV